MSTIALAFFYPPLRCSCAAARPPCPACQAYAHERFPPDGGPQEQEDVAAAPLVACDICAALFPLRTAQRSPHAKGQRLYCSEHCRIIQHRQTDAQVRTRQRRRGAL
jgi:hypothetical protein